MEQSKLICNRTVTMAEQVQQVRCPEMVLACSLPIRKLACGFGYPVRLAILTHLTSPVTNHCIISCQLGASRPPL